MTEKQRLESSLRRALYFFAAIALAAVGLMTTLVAAFINESSVLMISGQSELDRSEEQAVYEGFDGDTAIKEVSRYMEALPEAHEAVLEDLNTPYIDCELSKELQDYTYKVCQEYGVPFELAMAVMYVESRFDEDAYYLGNYGLMQINGVNHAWLQRDLGVTDFMDAKSNILCGVYMLSDLLEMYGEGDLALMCYNMGVNGAQQCGEYSTIYSRAVLEKYSEYIG